MKKIAILLSALAFVSASCIYTNDNSDVKELREKVDQLQKDVAELQEVNGITPSRQVERSGKTSESEESKKTVKSGKPDKEQAIEAIKYCLKMYQPSLKYTGIRCVEKPNGTLDVIIDYDWCGIASNTYYNVSMYGDGKFKVNSIDGVEGQFPHEDKFSIE